MKYPHVSAAFINAIREEGTKEEACDYLQEYWNESFVLRKKIKKLEDDIQGMHEDLAGENI